VGRVRACWAWLRNRRWWQFYLLLLVASQLVQWFRSDDVQLVPLDRVAEVQVQNSAGDTGDELVRVVYRDVGKGEPVILLHGSPGSLNNFDRFTNVLQPDVRLISVDLPGFGKSSKWIPDYSIKTHARYVLALMDQLELEQAHVLGFSMGSGVALHMAELAPQRVKSLALLAGIGIQEGEGTRDYAFEHLKYKIGYAALVVVPELIPHFGLLGPRAARHNFIRNFMDTDQRPLRGVLEQLDTPVLILQGIHDPLVPVSTAREHHRIVQHSELVEFDASHFMVFSTQGSRQLADEILPFVTRHADVSMPGLRRTVSYMNEEPIEAKTLPVDLGLKESMTPWQQAGAIIIGTFILEDPTSITVGLLIRRGEIDWFLGILAVFVGIFIGDLGLYAAGVVVGRRALRWESLARRLPARTIDALGAWFDRHGWTAVLVSRFVPGSRLPLYFSAGVLGRKPWRFAIWTFLAVMIWTPIIVLMVVFLGPAASSPAKMLFGDSWLALITTVLLLLVAFRIVALLLTREGRTRLLVKVSKIWRWEFWPPWIFYAPLVPWIVLLCFRYRGIRTITAANPCMPHGGLVGESKYDIMKRVPAEYALKCELIEPGTVEQRLKRLREVMDAPEWSYPIILKPNVGQRGVGVKRIHHEDQAAEYLQRHDSSLVIQQYHAGPFEAGVFYYRLPGAERGQIMSITDKHFSKLVGDGERTVRELVFGHSRYRMQWSTFLSRHREQEDRVLADGETFDLVVAGNHAQGTEFRDGAQLFTPELEQAVDQIARQIDGFYFGRFDVRYADPQAFAAGREMAIVELNGITSESTNLYDPSFSLSRAYRILGFQWLVLFKIGLRNRESRVAVSSYSDMLREVIAHFRRPVIEGVSD